MTILYHSKDKLIVGADTRKTALVILAGCIFLTWIVFVLLTNSSFFLKERMGIVANGIVILMTLCMMYYFYRVFGKISYTFDKKSQLLTISKLTILGTKKQLLQIDKIQMVEERPTATYAYHGHIHGAADAYHSAKNDNYYTTVVLHFSRTKELNLVPNAVYFFLHPFNHLTDSVDNGLGKTIAGFLHVPFEKQKRRKHALMKEI